MYQRLNCKKKHKSTRGKHERNITAVGESFLSNGSKHRNHEKQG